MGLGGEGCERQARKVEGDLKQKNSQGGKRKIEED